MRKYIFLLLISTFLMTSIINAVAQSKAKSTKDTTEEESYYDEDLRDFFYTDSSKNDEKLVNERREIIKRINDEEKKFRGSNLYELLYLESF